MNALQVLLNSCHLSPAVYAFVQKAVKDNLDAKDAKDALRVVLNCAHLSPAAYAFVQNAVKL